MRARPMVSANSLQGLMKWLRRDEWGEAFTDVLEKHLEPTCSKWDLAIEELPSVIGEDWYMNLWGCAFEDFLTREYDDNRNIVDDYLKRRGWKESATNKAYMTATCYWADMKTGERAVFDEARGGKYSNPPAFEAGGAGLASTVDDYLAFGRMMLNQGRHGNERILSRLSVELMTTDHITSERPCWPR